MNKKEAMEVEKEKFVLREKILKMEHKFKTERLKLERENTLLHHDLTLQRGRIKSADIRRMQERKAKY